MSLIPLGIATTTANANTARIFTKTFGCEAGAPGCITPDPYPLAHPNGVAVNESTGNVYVANNAGDNVQTIEVDATGGTFELVFEGHKTGPIAFKEVPPGHSSEHEAIAFENAAAIENALIAVAGAGNVEVIARAYGNAMSGGFLPTVTFIGALTDVRVAQMTAETAGLTGPGAAVHITTTSPGGPGDEVQEFNDQGEFVLMFGKDVNKTKVAGGVATEAEDNVCTKIEIELDHVECQAGKQGSKPGQFERPAYVAVDSSTGDVYVADGEHEFKKEFAPTIVLPERVTKFSEKGEVVPTWGDGGPEEKPDGQLVGKPAVGPDAEECTVTPCPAAEPFLYVSGIAVDPKGNLWVDGTEPHAGPRQGAQRMFEFARGGTFTGNAWILPEEAGSNGPHPDEAGIAVDSEDTLYAAGFVLSSTGAKLGYLPEVGAVDPSGHAYFNGGTEIAVYAEGCRSQGHGAASTCFPIESFGSAHPPGAGRLAVDSAAAGGTLYAAGSKIGQVLVYSNEVVAAVVTGKPSGVKLPEATLNGTVNPSGVPLEQCFFEWGETTAYGEPPVPCAEGPGNGPSEVGAGAVAVPVHATIAGLTAGHTYHYRLVAINKNDVNEPSVGDGQDVVFGPPLLVGEASADVAAISATVLAEVQAQNLDTRVRVEYGTEAGTYPDKPAAVDGGAGAGVATVPIELTGLTPGTVYHYRFVAENVLGEGPGAFVGPDHALETQGAGAFVLPDDRSWELASPPDLRGAAIEPLNTANEGGQGGVAEAAAQGGAITYVTTAPVEPEVRGYPEFSQALSRRVGGGGAGTSSTGWSLRALTVPHAPATPTGISFRGREYRWFSEDLSLAAVGPAGGFTPPSLEETRTGALTPLGGLFLGATPDGSHIVVATGSPTNYTFDLSEYTAGQPLAPVGEGALGDVSAAVQVTRHAISDDGSRVFFSTEHGLYMRDMVKGETIEIAGANALFEDANAAGNLVFFNGEECKVIANPGTGDLECPVIAQDGHVIGSSEDGSWFYYSINNELFVSHDGVPKLISSDSGPIGGGSYLREMTARVSPNGQWLAFMSQGSLTGYDNRDAVSGEPDEEVYLYDGETGQLACASCNPTGARPHGREYGGGNHKNRAGLPLVGGFGEWPGNTWLAANVPGWTQAGEVGGSSQLSFQPRYLSNSGRLFFNSSDALVPKDVNEQEDVYEYEPEGVPSGVHACSSAAASGSEVFKPAQPFDAEGVQGEEAAGCVSLISSGTSPDESAFLDASESGGDVFFLTASHLSPADVEGGNAIYDAHECTTESPCLTPSSPPPPCETAEGCRAAPEPQPGIYGAPPSATFNGIGNLTPTVTPPAVVKPKPKTVKCKRGFVKNKKDKCVRKAKAKKANTKRGAKR